jgi:mannose-1-phosphate guanylyltransferase
MRATPGLPEENFIGEPVGRDTLNAIGLSAALMARRDPEAVMAVFPADHLIEPAGEFRSALGRAFALAERRPEVLITFGVPPRAPSTAYGYLELGEPFAASDARRVRQFREKPDAVKAVQYFEAGSDKYVWNGGIFVWRAQTLLECIRRYRPDTGAELHLIAEAWDTPSRNSVLASVYPRLDKVSIDYAVMEPASQDPTVAVAAMPLSMQWLDIGSWPSFGQTLSRDAAGNAQAAPRCVLQDCSRTLAISEDATHLLAIVGCEDLIVVHTRDATLVCHAAHAEAIKRLHQTVAARFGEEYC